MLLISSDLRFAYYVFYWGGGSYLPKETFWVGGVINRNSNSLLDLLIYHLTPMGTEKELLGIDMFLFVCSFVSSVIVNNIDFHD